MKKVVFALLGIAFILPNVDAGIHKKAGRAGTQFLKIGVGAKALGMGEAFVAVADDITSIYWNPAGLMQNKEKEFILMHNKWLEDTNYGFIGLSQPIKNGKFGCGLAYFDYGDLIGRDKNNNLTGNFTAYDMALSLSYALTLKQTLTGATLKIIHQRNENEEANGVVLDLGIQYSLPQMKNLTLGAVIANIGKDIKFIKEKDPFPLTVKTGLYWSPLPKLLSGNLKLAFDLIKSKDDYTRLNMGGEYKLKDIFLRIGRKAKVDIGSGLTAGIGFNINSFQIDYSYTPFRDLNNSHIVSIITRF